MCQHCPQQEKLETSSQLSNFSQLSAASQLSRCQAALRGAQLDLAEALVLALAPFNPCDLQALEQHHRDRAMVEFWRRDVAHLHQQIAYWQLRAAGVAVADRG